MTIVFGSTDDPATPLDESVGPDREFLDGTGRFAGEETGLNKVDFWIGGLAEKPLASGGLLGSTFNFVFETQMENLQNGDRFYYLSRLEGTNFLTQLEGTSFSELVMRNTSATHLPFDVFSVPDLRSRRRSRHLPGRCGWSRPARRLDVISGTDVVIGGTDRTEDRPVAVMTRSGAMAATISSMVAPATTRSSAAMATIAYGSGRRRLRQWCCRRRPDIRRRGVRPPGWPGGPRHCLRRRGRRRGIRWPR